MLTPLFTLSQDDEYVFISIQLKHIRLQSTPLEMVVDDRLFVFLMAPYYLRLRLPYLVVEDERAEAKMGQADTVEVRLPKEIKGQVFPDLDLHAKLLARTEPQLKPLIEEVGVDNTEVKEGDVEDGEAHQWEISQAEPTESVLPLEPDVKYGFNGNYHDLVGVSMMNGNDINELGDPENTPAAQRTLERLIKENVKFDPEMYAADYIAQVHPSDEDDKDYKRLLAWKNPSTKQFLAWHKEHGSDVVGVTFTESEQKKMMDLPRRTYLVDSPVPLFGFLCLFLFSYHYELRAGGGEHTTESAWTVGKLTPQLAYLDASLVSGDGQDYLNAVVLTGMRRCLCYPYHRNYDLGKKAWQDTYYNIRGGKRLVLRTMLAAKELFRYHDVYYVYDKIWLEDMCTWLISDLVSEADLRQLAYDLKKKYDAVTKQTVTFEKADDDEEFFTLSLEDIDELAENAYNQMAG